MKISKKRWDEAQEFEVNDWSNEENIVEKEWIEAVNKYEKFFTVLSKKLKITSSWNILDVGCSVTCVSRLIKKGNHYGVEPLASALNANEIVKEVEITNGLGENMHFYQSEMFNLVICRNVIDHTHSPKKVISEIERVLKPNGYFVLACYVYNPFISFIKNLGERLYVLRNVGHPHTYTMNSLKKLVTQFETLETIVIYEGVGPNDFGKVDEVQGDLGLVERAVLFVDQKIVRNKWFVREYLILCQKK